MSSGFYRTQCIVCGREDKYRKKLRYFRFPKKTERCRDWLRVIGIKDLIYMSLSELFEQIVCEIHFQRQCFSRIGKHLLKVALPTMFTSHPPLPANIMAEWPPKYDQVPQVQQYDQENKGGNRDPTLCDTYPVINYERPLMTCMETLINNKQGYGKKPAGTLNTISVPLMTYCNSMEKGTVFAPDEPADLSNLPVVIIENIEMNTATKNSMLSNTTDSILRKKSPGMCLPYSVDVSQQYETINKYTKYGTGTPMNTVHPYESGTLHQYINTKDIRSAHTNAPLTGSMNQECKATINKKPIVSSGLNTIIRSKSHRTRLPDSNNMLQQYETINKYTKYGAGTPINTMFHPYKTGTLHQYKNTKAIRSAHTNAPLTGSMNQECKPTSNKKHCVVSIGLDTIIKSRKTEAKLSSQTVPTQNSSNHGLILNWLQATKDYDTNFSSTPGPNTLYIDHEKTTTDSGTIFAEHLAMPNTQYSDAHISGGNINYDIPLLNCMGIVLQGNVNYNAKLEDIDTAPIKVPLMTCMKIIQSVE